MENLKITKILPVQNSNFDNITECGESIIFCKRQSTHRNVFSKKMDNLYDIIYTHYKHTPSYNLSNANYPLFTRENNIINRAKRFLFEDYIIVEQNNYTRFNYIFTFILIILTIIMILYINHNDLILAPKKIINENIMTEEDKKVIKYYDKIELSSKIINGVSALYIIILSSYRIFKRTTI